MKMKSFIGACALLLVGCARDPIPVSQTTTPKPPPRYTSVFAGTIGLGNMHPYGEVFVLNDHDTGERWIITMTHHGVAISPARLEPKSNP